MMIHPLPSRRLRRGLTLTELLIASSVMTIIAGGMGLIVTAVHATGSHCRSQSMAVQHGRVTLDRIHNSVRAATASDEFPGCLVITTSVSSHRYPDTLVVWRPTGAPADPAGRPRVCELLIYCPDPNVANRLVEIRPVSTNTATVPAISSTSSWAALVSSLKTSASSTVTELTDRVRTASASASSGNSSLRGCVRFLLLSAPTDAEWTAYKGGTLAWNELSWPLDLYGTQTGIRRVACQTEIQIIGEDAATASQTAIPLFGSAAVTFEVNR
jgi:prepilin-type N-terminal cleavage/methylation domain-containing protein